jgi:hypothetical protein
MQAAKRSAVFMYVFLIEGRFRGRKIPDRISGERGRHADDRARKATATPKTTIGRYERLAAVL